MIMFEEFLIIVIMVVFVTVIIAAIKHPETAMKCICLIALVSMAFTAIAIR